MAWTISDKEDTQTLEVVWTVVKKRCPQANVNVLMTDDGEMKNLQIALFLKNILFTDLAGVLACSHVYPNVCHILCRWHIDR